MSREEGMGQEKECNNRVPSIAAVSKDQTI